MAQVRSEPAVGPIGPGTEGLSAPGIRGKTPWQLFWMRFRKDRAALVGLVFIALLVIVALGAPLVADLVGHGPNERFQREMTDEFGLPSGPNADFFFGADKVGRDVFVRAIYGARTSLMVALLATGAAMVIGILLGMLAGYRGGWVDTAISRLIDVILSMPVLLFAIGIVASCSVSAEGCLGGLVRPGLPLVVFVIALFSWPYVARLVRGNTLSIREKDFIEASRSLGSSNFRIMLTEVLPNLVASIIVYATLIIPTNILFEAALSFLGLGVPQTIPSWGRMIADGAPIFDVAWWLMVFPGFFILFTTLAFNLVGDGLRDALDPRTGG